MSHDPSVKAKAVADVAGGMRYEVAAEKHGVARKTLQRWVREVQEMSRKCPEKAKGINPGEARRQKFNEALETFLHSTIVMLNAWAQTCSDPSFIVNNPEGVNELGRTVLDRADRMVSTLKPIGNDKPDE